MPTGQRDFFGQMMYQEVPPLNATALKQIAETGNGQFFRATDTRSLEEVYQQIDHLEKSSFQMKQYRQYRDLFPWFVAAGALLLLVNVGLSQTVRRRLP